MAKGKSGGYVYGIKDPRLTAAGKLDVVFVGNGRRPWESVQRHLQDSSNPEMWEWAKGLFEDFPEGLVIHDHIVCDAYHGEEVEFPQPIEGRTLVEWVIFDIEDEGDEDEPGMTTITPKGTKKQKVIERLRKEGHPLMNKESGRPVSKY